jgi:endoglucanase
MTRSWLRESTVFVLSCAALSACSSNGSTSGQSSSGGSSAGVSGAQTSGGGSSATAGAGASQLGGAGSGGSLGGASSGAGGSAGSVATAGGGSSSGGSSGAGSPGTAGASGKLSPQEFVKAMAPGWNLGNTFDAEPNETSWGNPETTQAMIQAVHAAGFNTIRIPVTWTNHIGPAPTYTVDPAWMAKVVQVAAWANEAGLYFIINTHHDTDAGGFILFDVNGNPISQAQQTQLTTEVGLLWTQIATTFNSYGDHLIFECFNEPGGNNQYGGGDAFGQGLLNKYLASCMSAIRATGGNNATRYVMVQGEGASAIQSSIQAVVIPNNDPNVLFSVHDYFPYQFSGGGGATTWGSGSDYAQMAGAVKAIPTWLPASMGIVLGEWGSVQGDDVNSRVAHATAWAHDTAVAGIAPVVWDDGGNYDLLNRSSNPPSWRYQTIVDGIMAGHTAGLAPGATYATGP